MKRKEMLKIASELNRCLAYSDIEGSVEYEIHGDSAKVIFIHYDERYELDSKILFIYDWLDDEKTNQSVDKVKNVIAGEELIND
ncbi:hypothetical protein [Staphylococcus coagulans]|uniref:hypothetical protein n=1 Tax=Staphylococcus coagulans TaxID=74706 RepID=UPI001BEC58AF|nr:hypothetical protein [Staphylococcus coagulans]MBT2818528.1 hypothetical protein [Staphylococcus coagulans]